MLNKKDQLNDKESFMDDYDEGITRMLVADEFKQEMADMPSLEELAALYPKSPAQQEREKKMFAALRREKRMRKCLAALRRTAAALVIALAVSAVVFSTSVEARNFITRFFASFTSQSVRFDAAEEKGDIPIGRYMPEYFPEGYRLSDEFVRDDHAMILLVHETLDVIRLQYHRTDDISILTQNQDIAYARISRGGLDFHVLEPEAEGMLTQVIWESGELAFHLNGVISSDELIQIALSLVLQG